MQSYNKSLITQACSGPYWENIGPWSFLYGPRCARSVLSRPRADILPVRPSRLVNKIYIYTLENAEQYQTLHLLYTLAFRMSPPENLVLTNSNADHKKEKQDFLVALMCENFVFAHGDDGGVIIRCQNDNADEHGNVDDILRDLQGADLSNSEVRALCIVELLDGLKKDDVGGDFFILPDAGVDKYHIRLFR